MSIESLIVSGRIADIVLGVMVAEAVIMAMVMKRSGRFSAYPTILSGLAAGACLILALRAALTGDGWLAIALFLTLGLFAHVAEIGFRKWR